MQACNQNSDKVVDFILDNTNANMKALDLLERMFPLSINSGCISHSLHLAIKDQSKKKNSTELENIIADVLKVGSPEDFMLI